jgi:hypothetical protein
MFHCCLIRAWILVFNALAIRQLYNIDDYKL